jgi:hypothetical protein
MNEHRRDWLGQFRGVNFRFAEVKPLRGLKRDRQIVEEIEGALVYELQPLYNDKKKNSYSIRHDLEIMSAGSRGEVPQWVSTAEH